MTPDPCPFSHDASGAHSYEHALIEGYILVLYCQQCGDRIWPKGLTDATERTIDATIKTEVAA